MARPEDNVDRPGKGKGDPDHKTQPNKPTKEEETGGIPPDPNAPRPDQTLPGDLPPNPDDEPHPDQTLPGDLPKP